MNEILEMAKKCGAIKSLYGFTGLTGSMTYGYQFSASQLEAFTRIMKAEGLEEAAQICDSLADEETYGAIENYAEELTDRGLDYQDCADIIRQKAKEMNVC